VPSFPNQTILDLTSLSKEDIQGYGIVLKVLDGKYEREMSSWLIVLFSDRFANDGLFRSFRND